MEIMYSATSLTLDDERRANFDLFRSAREISTWPSTQFTHPQSYGQPKIIELDTAHGQVIKRLRYLLAQQQHILVLGSEPKEAMG